jgi:hypothetical protein
MISEDYHPVACILVIQFKGIFVEHFCFHQFGVVIRGRCEIMVHGF